MKSNLFILSLLIFSFSSHSAIYAKPDTLIYKCSENLTKSKSDYAPFYVKVFNYSDGTFGVKQYRKNGVPFMFGGFTDKKLTVKFGDFVYFDNDGNKKREGRYENDLEAGVWRWIHKNGVIASEGKYVGGKRVGLWIYKDEEGVKNRESNYVEGKLEGTYFEWSKAVLITDGSYSKDLKTGQWKVWYPSGALDSEGAYKGGERDGEWRFYFESGKIAALEEYDKGVPTSVKWFNEDGSAAVPTDPLERDPDFSGGMKQMQQFLLEHLNYPEEARENGEQGVVYVQFYIEPDGSITDIRVVKGVSKSLDAEAIRVIEAMPKWLPAYNHNRAKRIKYTIPLTFRLG